MITIKCTRNKLFTEYLKWIDPLLNLSKGERDILASMLTLHYSHKSYPPDILDELLFSKETQQQIRKKLKINQKLYDKLFNSLKEKGIIEENRIKSTFTKYPKDGNFKLYINFEIE